MSDNFHKICVVGGGLTGAFMTLLIKKIKYVYDNKEIAWIKPKVNIENDFRTTFYNSKSLRTYLKKLSVLQNIPDKDITAVKTNSRAFGKKKMLLL